jgi:hypothetical protein
MQTYNEKSLSGKSEKEMLEKKLKSRLGWIPALCEEGQT